MNSFLKQTTKENTTTENGAISNSSSGSILVDYFGHAGTYKGRDINEVIGDISACYGENPLQTLQMLFYLRGISRKPKSPVNQPSDNLTNSFSGMGLKDEALKALSWIDTYHPEVMAKNLWLLPTVGNWHDLFYFSSEINSKKTGVKPEFSHFFQEDETFELIKIGMQDDFHRQLIAKYLPAIKAKSKCKTDRAKALTAWAKRFCKFMKWSYEDYRKFKSNPTNTKHLWQRQMSAREWYDIDFNKIPGRALMLLNSTGKDKVSTITRHQLEEKYLAWIKTKPVLPFTGYVHELYQQSRKGLNLIKKYTIDKQFDGLIEKARKNSNGGLNENIWCALDTSGSMDGLPLEVCMSLGIYFSTLNTGAFKDHVIMFDDKSTVKKLSGTFTDKISQVPSNSMGGTNFQSVIDEIVRIRKTNPNIPVSEYPTTLLVVSDNQFNPSGNNVKTNYQTAMDKLKAVELPNIKIIWWNVNGYRNSDSPSTIDDAGTTLISGYDGSIITLLVGGEQTTIDQKTGEVRQLNPQEQMEKVLNQDLLKLVRV